MEPHQPDKIILERMEFFGHHGVHSYERCVGQKFVVDVVCGKDLQKAGVSDDLEETCDYSKIYSTIREIVEGPPFKLIESLSESIAASILKHYDVDDVTVRVAKPETELGPEQIGQAAVEIFRART